MADQYIGEIRMFGGNYPPQYWALCDGQLLPIAQNTALFSLLGTTYGGNGQTTFALPNLIRRVPLHRGQGPGLSPRDLGEIGGEENVTLTANELPAHTHGLRAAAGAAVSRAANGRLFAAVNTPVPPYHPQGTALGAMAPGTLAPAGGSQPHNNMQPYLAITFIIALQGIYPPRP